MGSKAVWAAGALITVTGLFLAPACGGSDPEVIGSADAGGGDTSTPVVPTDSGNTVTGECNVNEDCVAKLPKTTPENCAVATCDTIQKKCHFKSKDADGDGHNAKNCSGATATIEIGDDCDDNDPTTQPGAWDGPATDFDAGPGAQSDRCDQKDNDCNGSPDDGKIPVDGGDKSCKCDPNKPLPCYEYPNGVPIDATTLDMNNNPKGACRKGTRTCTAGVPNACVGAVGPAAEVCDTLDHDCDGVSGNAGDTVTGAPSYCVDADNDGYCLNSCITTCSSPGTTYRLQSTCVGALGSDCNDAVQAIHPNAAEVCNGIDDNCGAGIDEGFNINGACTAGNAGVCKRTGTTQCDGTTTTKCSPGAGTAGGESLTASTDPLVYTGTDSNLYKARYDWDCSGANELRPSNLTDGGFTYLTGSAVGLLCSGNRQAACQASAGSLSTCKSVVYPCATNCGGINCSIAQACGQVLTVAHCSWDFNANGSGCDTYGPTNVTMGAYCR